jgi:hypothetical protein
MVLPGLASPVVGIPVNPIQERVSQLISEECLQVAKNAFR